MLCNIQEREKGRYYHDTKVENEYLAFDILLPWLKDADIKLFSIDYEAFDLDDIRAMSEFSIENGHGLLLIFELIEMLRNVAPKVNQSCKFC